MHQEKINHIGVLGGGIQGCCMALLFRKLGYQVTIIEQATELMSRSSANQEGKIHMGFIYSNDLSLQTGYKLLNDSLHFAYCMEYLLDKPLDWDSFKSEKFIYLVPNDSMCSIEHLNHYFEVLQNEYDRIMECKPHLSYLGSRPKKIFYSIPVPDFVDPKRIQYCFQTEEVAISQNILRQQIKSRLIEKTTGVILNSKVIRVDQRIPFQYEVKTDQGTYSFDYLVNCLWENQSVVDRQVGMINRDEINLRLKFGVVSSYLNELATIPSTSMVCGQYGDFVNFKCEMDRRMYFSWYPVSRYGMVTNQDMPVDWNDLCNGQIPDHLLKYQLDQHATIYQKLFSIPFEFASPKLIAGIIVAKGTKDIDDPHSALHQRNETPLKSMDTYLSVSTGKFTSAPYNAYLARQIIPSRA